LHVRHISHDNDASSERYNMYSTNLIYAHLNQLLIKLHQYVIKNNYVRITGTLDNL
jgi:hypothetical protein